MGVLTIDMGTGQRVADTQVDWWQTIPPKEPWIAKGLEAPKDRSEELRSALEQFHALMRDAIVVHGAKSGYGETDSDRLNLFEFTEKRFPGHAAGEIIYKLMGWEQEHDPGYLIKVATWAFLLWMHHQRLGTAA